MASTRPSGEKEAHSTWQSLPNLMVLLKVVGHLSSSSSFPTATPLSKSISAPSGSAPCSLCHLRAWPTIVMRREGGMTETSWARSDAIFDRLLSLVVSG